MDVQARFGLKENPFTKNKRNNIVIETSELREVLTRLDYLKNCQGFGVITGEPGKGKTSAVRKWTEGLNPSLYKVVYISISTLTTNDFYRRLAEELNCEPMHRKADNYRNIQEAVTRYSVEKRITPVIILDEANYISNEILNDLKMIFNFDMDSRERAIILLVGLPSLNNKLNLNAHEPLKQRLVMNYHMESLNQEESKIYIKEKLKSAGCHEDIFDSTALQAVISSANGVPRIVDKLCNRCLIIADSSGKDRITEETIMKALSDVELG